MERGGGLPLNNIVSAYYIWVFLLSKEITVTENSGFVIVVWIFWLCSSGSEVFRQLFNFIHLLWLLLVRSMFFSMRKVSFMT
jgi:hypothetical protein